MKQVSDRPSGGSLMTAQDCIKIAKIYGGFAFLDSLPGSPADRAGLRRGDIIIAVNGVPTPDADAFVNARQQREGGALVRYVRDGVEREVELRWDSP